MEIIETTVLYKDGETLVVNADSEQEAQLKADGWTYKPVVSKAKPKAKAKRAPKSENK